MLVSSVQREQEVYSWSRIEAAGIVQILLKPFNWEPSYGSRFQDHSQLVFGKLKTEL
jgi:hypothetical protein